jgi:hypothetical protein
MIVTKNNIFTGKKSCILCCKVFEYLAIVSGEINANETEIERLHKGKEVASQVVVLKKSIGNNNKLHIIDVEITVRCPHCHSNNRFNEFITILNTENQ